VFLFLFVFSTDYVVIPSIDSAVENKSSNKSSSRAVTGNISGRFKPL